MQNINKIFNKFFNGEPNFVTPHPVEYGVLCETPFKLVYELSQGVSPFSDNMVFGVTVLEVVNKDKIKRAMPLDMAFMDIDTARKYIKDIKASKELIENILYGVENAASA
jgi:hypothetical protein